MSWFLRDQSTQSSQAARDRSTVCVKPSCELLCAAETSASVEARGLSSCPPRCVLLRQSSHFLPQVNPAICSEQKPSSLMLSVSSMTEHSPLSTQWPFCNPWVSRRGPDARADLKILQTNGAASSGLRLEDSRSLEGEGQSPASLVWPDLSQKSAYRRAQGQCAPA